MPSQSSKSSSRASAGGEAKNKRSQVTGRQLGKADLRAARKNAECVYEYMYAVGNSSSAAEFEEMTTALNTIVARVTRGFGAGRFEVSIVDGSTERIHVAGSVSLRGRAATKTDRDNCMCVGDYILVRAGLASAKLSIGDVKRIHDFYDTHSIKYPKHFFGSEEDGDDLFDYSDTGSGADGYRPSLKANNGGVAVDGDADSVADDDEDDDIDISMI
jgi:hypothetical protein